MKSALEILEKYKGEVETELEKHLPRTGEPKEFYESIWDLLDRGGKRFRPALTFLACECVGGTKNDALGAAASVEVLHNMTLVHDDIEDRSELRRGKPCIHRIYGIPTAINAGDAMLIKVFEIANASKIPQDRCHQLVEHVAERAYEITWGQAFEFNMWKRRIFTEDEVVRLLKCKTGALTRLSTEAGAIAGGAPQEQVNALANFGETVGIAFQIVDDILNVTGNVRDYGKEIGGDIREGKKTIIAAHLLGTASQSDQEIFRRLLGRKKITRAGTKKAIELYEKYGSIAYAKARADSYLANALTALNTLPASDAREELGTIAHFLVSRSF
jgi:geranylgeranyl diphosphate synthase type I